MPATPARTLTVGTPVLRMPYPRRPDAPVVDGVPNFFHVTRPDRAGDRLPGVAKGINRMARVGTGADVRHPVILLRSAPHRAGSAATPWQDTLQPDAGYILYHGDNKTPGRPAHLAPGNAVLLGEYASHVSPRREDRLRATPLVFLRNVALAGRAKGCVVFQGYGVLERVELVTQFDEHRDRHFGNYVFHCAVLSMAHEAEAFDWEWINARRDAGRSLEDTLARAPRAWREWVAAGSPALERVRRRATQRRVVSARLQRPVQGTIEYRMLSTIYEFYREHRHRFEALAAEVTGRILGRSGGRYSTGWITRRSADGGVDFVGRLDLGSEFSRVPIVVLGQAKCESLNQPTGGQDVARTVARLRRGWVGAYVTTSYFSEPLQREVLDDGYPVLLVGGARLVRETTELAREANLDLSSYLGALDLRYAGLVQSRRPEEVLHEVGSPLGPDDLADLVRAPVYPVP